MHIQVDAKEAWRGEGARQSQKKKTKNAVASRLKCDHAWDSKQATKALFRFVRLCVPRVFRAVVQRGVCGF